MEWKNAMPYQAPNLLYYGFPEMRGKEESGIQTFWAGLTHFLPGGCMGGVLAVESLLPGI